ncbi:glycosyltransferase family 2 protein [Thalassococcus sp. S3]|uniref:glycosyltransferase family 2 protein n=1 Tax=Thalassococcus sp. S3 TaxID=2017482 RepID=UPI001024933B|nr:glycosyltransferase family 2 protein [Thalassococcus sp. S3]QBF29801.1 hypothetical protein CFI11_01030 [Thalassococcus sp. S3]
MKISIVIPTRERIAYLPASIQTALDIDDPDIEVVVNDNASQDGTEDVVRAIEDPRLRYFNTGQRVAMRENFNQAVTNATGDYVVVFGDDDGILPGQFRHLRDVLERHRPDGLSWTRATYGWPIPGFGQKTGGIRFYRDGTFGAPQPYDPSRNERALLSCDLAKMVPSANIYHGCVAKAYLERVAPSSGVFFDGAIPDVNFEYRAALVGGAFLHCDHPFSINGHSPASNGGAQKGFKADDPRSKPAQQFDAENRADTYQDVMDNARFVPLVLFSTLETLRRRMGDARRPDFKAWYHMVVSGARNKPEVSENVEAILKAYAEETGTTAELAQAYDLPAKRKKTLGERVARIRSQINSLRVSAEKDGENTILTAARVYDEILANDLGAVLDNTLSRDKAWRAAKQRSRNFKREL